MNMFERVEAALRKVCDDADFSYGGIDVNALFYDKGALARAAIEAMREPTEAMLAAGVKSWGFDFDANSTDGINANITGEYQSMIDAALKE